MGFDGAFFIALPAAFLAVALLGLVVEAGALRFVYGRGLIPPMLVTWALASSSTKRSASFSGGTSSP